MRSRRRPWPRSARTSGCWTRSPAGTWAWQSGCAAGSGRPSARSRRASHGGRRPACTTMVALWCQYLGQMQRAQGHLDAALATYQRALEIAPRPASRPLPAAGIAHVGMAEVAYQRDELDTAAAAPHRGHRAVPPVRLHRRRWRTAWRRWPGSGRPEATRPAPWTRWTEAERVAEPDVVDLLNPVPAQRARLLLAQGDVDAAARWTSERGLDAGRRAELSPGAGVSACWPECCSRKGSPTRRSGSSDRLHAAAAAQDRIGSVIEIQALRALALRGARRRGRRGGHPGGGAHAGPPPGLCPGLRRRGRRRWPPCSAGSSPLTAPSRPAW